MAAPKAGSKAALRLTARIEGSVFKLSTLARHGTDKSLLGAIRENNKLIRQEIRRTAPRAKVHLQHLDPKPLRRHVRGKTRKSRRDRAIVLSYVSVPQGPGGWIEQGTKSRRTSTRYTGFLNPRPFVLPAVAKVGKLIPSDVKRRIRQRVTGPKRRVSRDLGRGRPVGDFF